MKYSERVLKAFNSCYDDLYNGVIESDPSLINEFDERNHNDSFFNSLVAFFNETRMDFLTSDREVNAFMLAIDSIDCEEKFYRIAQEINTSDERYQFLDSIMDFCHNDSRIWIVTPENNKQVNTIISYVKMKNGYNPESENDYCNKFDSLVSGETYIIYENSNGEYCFILSKNHVFEVWNRLF